MYYWKFGDGTTVYSQVRVAGQSPFAEHLRRELICLAFGCGPLVWLAEQAHAVELDATNDHLLAPWLEQEARLYGLGLVETNFDTAVHSSHEPNWVSEGNHG